MNEFLELKYDEIVKMAEKITQDRNHREIAHYIIEQFMIHPRAQELIDKGEAMRFMSGMIHRNYHSSNSPYDKLYRQKRRVYTYKGIFAEPTTDNPDDICLDGCQHKAGALGKTKKQEMWDQHLTTNVWGTDYDIQDDIRLEGIEGILEDMMGEGFGHYWYIATLFRMWVDNQNYSDLSRKTLIPRTSIAFAVEECREYIIKRLQDANID
jgi:hypothetical protein